MKTYTLNLKPETFDIIYHDMRDKIQQLNQTLENIPDDLPHLRRDTLQQIDTRMKIYEHLIIIDTNLNDPDPD